MGEQGSERVEEQGRKIETFSSLHRHFASIGSTNDAARDWGHEGAPHLAVVTAARQTMGRGRRGREWASLPDRGLYASFILRPGAAAGGLAAVPRLTMLLSLATAYAVEEMTGLRAEVKWPNDVLLNGRKIAGILCEAHLLPLQSRWSDDPAEVLDFCVVGVGLNLNFSPEELPTRPVFPASSLRIETGRTFKSEEALQAVWSQFRALDTRFASGEWERLRVEWEGRCHGLGSAVTVRAGNQEWGGVALMTDTDGALLVSTPNGLKRVVAGDVSFAD